MGLHNPLAEELNDDLRAGAPQIYSMLSDRGKAIYFPFKGILGQTAEAKNATINATIGTAFENDGSPLTLETMEALISYLSNNTHVGQTITVSILRGGKAQELKITLQARPSETANTEVNRRTITPRASGAWLGIDAVSLDADIATAMGLEAGQKGALINGVAPDGPADQAGLRGGSERAEANGRQVVIGGDLIVAIDGDEITSLEDLIGWLDQAEAGQEATVTILRNGRQMELTVTLGERPA